MEVQSICIHKFIGKRVAKLDKEGNVINIFPSVLEATRITGITKTIIYPQLYGQRSWKEWKYLDEINEPDGIMISEGNGKYILTKDGKVFTRKLRRYLKPLEMGGVYLSRKYYNIKNCLCGL